MFKYHFILLWVLVLTGCATNSGKDDSNNSNNVNNSNNINNSNNSNNQTDTDGDGVVDSLDPCPFDNPDDSDDDGVCDSDDICPGFDDNLDSDNDGVPDGCDPCPLDNPDDSDGDGVCDSDDICPGFDDNLDSDNDGVPDGCDPCPLDNPDDSDGDGICDSNDICPGFNDIIDGDNDGVPDGCDPCPLDNPDDSDGDGVCDSDDQCPGHDDSIDTNNNGIPDGCEILNAGSYEYSRYPAGGINKLVALDVHPDNSLFIILEYSNLVYFYDLNNNTFIGINPGESGETIYWEEIKFSPDGNEALLMGYETNSGNGVVFKYDHSSYLLNPSQPQDALTRFSSLPAWVEVFTSTVYDFYNQTLLLGRNNSWPYNLYLFSFDTTTGSATQLEALNSGAGCQEMTKVNNEYGDPGVLITCGINGSDTYYYTLVSQVPELRHNPGNNNIGNTSHLGAHPDGSHALLISWSGDAVYRFESGLINSYSDAPRFSTRRIWNIGWQPNGQRALIVGKHQTLTSGSFATIIEYRNGFYDCPTPFSNCELNEVSIQNFDQAPWIAPTNTILSDIVWRNDCDGGLIAGGKNDYSTSYGVIIQFQLVGGRVCSW